MKAPHLLRVEAGADAFAPLFAAARAARVRLGWLDLATAERRPVPAALAPAAAAGAFRAVAVGSDGAVAVKPRQGAPVLADLLREHYLGCRAVLVRGELAGLEAAARLARVAAEEGGEGGEGGRWQVTPAGGPPLELDGERLLARLRRPRPWGGEGGESSEGGG